MSSAESASDSEVEVLCNYINGVFRAPSTNEYLDNFAPATGKVLSKVPRSSSSDVNDAVAAAKAAFPAWSALPTTERIAYLRKIIALLRERLPELAALESTDTGKPLSLATSVDIPRSIDNFEFFCGAALHDSTECHISGGSASSPAAVAAASAPAASSAALNYTQRRAVGVAGLITPWNLPLYLLTWKVAPALALGNTVVAKPSELTPHTATALARICSDVGLPNGVFNIVHGTGAVAGQSLVAHPDVPLISFTGGTATGAIVAATAAPLFKKLSLELGGKNATVVFGDADLDDAIATGARSAFTNQGQVCLSGSRVFVHSSVYDKFEAGFVAEARARVCGDPSKATFGAVISAQHRDKVRSYISLAQTEGGRVLCGGDVTPLDLPKGFEEGYFVPPTVIAGLEPTARTSQEEIFGPVIVLHRFETEEEVLAAVNGTKYGLAGSVFTKDLARAHRFAQQWETGMVWVNTWMYRDLRVPFGGAKASGVGTEGGKYSIDFFSQVKNVCIKL